MESLQGNLSRPSGGQGGVMYVRDRLPCGDSLAPKRERRGKKRRERKKRNGGKQGGRMKAIYYNHDESKKNIFFSWT